MLHVAASRARGDGCESWGARKETGKLETGACAKHLEIKSVKERGNALGSNPVHANETPLTKGMA